MSIFTTYIQDNIISNNGSKITANDLFENFEMWYIYNNYNYLIMMGK